MLLIDPKLLFGGLLLALALDACFGDPKRLWGRVPHPVVLMGRAIARLEARRLDLAMPAIVQVRRGRDASLLVIGASVLFALGVQELCIRLPLGWLLLGLAMSTLIAARGLHDHVAAVATALQQGLEGGRQAIAQIVGRDPASLDEHGVARAAIESTAENFADGVVAPLLWGVLLGLPGMAAYKAINTLDSMIGHRSARYLHFGRFAARLDDVANWLPARLSALLILAAAVCLPGATPAAGWRAMWRDAPRHRSPNAGWPEAALAGALGLRLAGPRRYAGEAVDDAWMGDGRGAATPADVGRALRVLVIACALASILLGSALLVATEIAEEGDAALGRTLARAAPAEGLLERPTTPGATGSSRKEQGADMTSSVQELGTVVAGGKSSLMSRLSCPPSSPRAASLPDPERRSAASITRPDHRRIRQEPH
jgi:adenosylcobinamide-phosphate synthase